MTQVYLIRHAEAEGNLYRRIQGQYNSLITDNGYRQIEALSTRFADVHIDAVYSSDLFRTMTTAKAVYEPKKLPLETHPGLREIGLGIWEDRTWAEAARLAPDTMVAFNKSASGFAIEGGETFAQVQARMVATIADIVANHPNQAVAVVSHGVAIRMAQAAYQNSSIDDSTALGHSDNTAVSLFEFDNGAVNTVYLNDNSHLTDQLSTLYSQAWWRSHEVDYVDTNLWFRPLDMETEGNYYLEARTEAWLNIRGNLDKFDGQAFLADARHHARFNPNSIMCAMHKDEIAGLIQMDFQRHRDQDVGYIPFVYMSPKYRKKGVGVQLLGQAVCTYRPMGRRYLRLRCAPDNGAAQRFYKRYGFRKIGQAEGARVPLDILEKYIGY